MFFDVIGEEYIPIAFKAAAEADPKAKLYYNDNQTDRPDQPRVKGVRNIVKLIRDRGGRIDGVGRQAHIGIDRATQEEQMQAMQMWDDLDVDIILTELDVGVGAKTKEGVPRTITKEVNDKQQEAFRRTAAACVATKRCLGIIVWVHTDRVRSPAASLLGSDIMPCDSLLIHHLDSTRGSRVTTRRWAMGAPGMTSCGRSRPTMALRLVSNRKAVRSREMRGTSGSRDVALVPASAPCFALDAGTIHQCALGPSEPILHLSTGES